MFWKRNEVFPSLDLIFAISLLLAVPLAAFSPWRPVFIDAYVQNTSAVGLITALFSLVLIPFYIVISRLVLKWGKTGLLLGSVVLMFLSSLLSVIPFFSVFILGHIIYLLTRAFAFFILELFVKKYSPDDQIHSIQGKISAIVNLGWFLGPMVGGFLVTQFGIWGILWFLAGAAIMNILLTFRGLTIFDPQPSSPPVNTGTLKNDFKEFLSRPDYKFYYFIGLGLNMVYAVTTTFLPLLLLSFGASNELLGFGFALSVLPFVVFEPLVGMIADKMGKERLLFALGFLVMSLSLILTGFFKSPYALIGLLILGSCGASLIEAVDQSLFMKKANHHKTFMIGVFSTAGSLGYVAALIFSSLVLIFFNLSSLFVLFGFLLLSFSYVSLRLDRSVDG